MKERRKRPVRGGGIRVVVMLPLMLILLLGSAQMAAAQCTASEANIRDAILGRISIDVATMDCNGDGQVDVADLVYLAKQTGVSVAEFAAPTSEIEEGAGSLSVTVNFSPEFSGTLSFSVSPEPSPEGECPDDTIGGCSTATAGADYITLSGSISVSDVDSVDIPITISDDGELEDIETIVLRLEEGPGYIPGAATVHTVYVYDNDAIWNGAIEHSGLAVHFQMKIIQQGGGATGALVTDGYGIIPLNGESTEWPATGMTLNDTSFGATVEGITIPATSTLANVDMVRELVFTANSVEPTVISGAVTEEVTCDGAPQFAYTMDGTFALLKQIPTMPEELINP